MVVPNKFMQSFIAEFLPIDQSSINKNQFNMIETYLCDRSELYQAICNIAPFLDYLSSVKAEQDLNSFLVSITEFYADNEDSLPLYKKSDLSISDLLDEFVDRFIKLKNHTLMDDKLTTIEDKNYILFKNLLIPKKNYEAISLEYIESEEDIYESISEAYQKRLNYHKLITSQINNANSGRCPASCRCLSCYGYIIL